MEVYHGMRMDGEGFIVQSLPCLWLGFHFTLFLRSSLPAYSLSRCGYGLRSPFFFCSFFYFGVLCPIPFHDSPFVCYISPWRWPSRLVGGDIRLRSPVST